MLGGYLKILPMFFIVMPGMISRALYPGESGPVCPGPRQLFSLRAQSTYVRLCGPNIQYLFWQKKLVTGCHIKTLLFLYKEKISESIFGAFQRDLSFIRIKGLNPKRANQAFQGTIWLRALPARAKSS